MVKLKSCISLKTLIGLYGRNYLKKCVASVISAENGKKTLSAEEYITRTSLNIILYVRIVYHTYLET